MFQFTNNGLALADEDVYLGSVTGRVTALELVPSSRGLNNAADAADYWR